MDSLPKDPPSLLNTKAERETSRKVRAGTQWQSTRGSPTLNLHSHTNNIVQNSTEQQQIDLCLGAISVPLHLRGRLHLPRHGGRLRGTVRRFSNPIDVFQS